MRRLSLTWIAACLLLVAAVRTVEIPALDRDPAEVVDDAPEALEISRVIPERTYRPLAIANTLLAVEGRIVYSNDAIHNWSGSIGVTLLDGRTGKLVRAEVNVESLNEPRTGWQWWYERH